MAKKLINFRELEAEIRNYANENCVPEGKKDGNFSMAVRELISKGLESLARQRGGK